MEAGDVDAEIPLSVMLSRGDAGLLDESEAPLRTVASDVVL